MDGWIRLPAWRRGNTRTHALDGRRTGILAIVSSVFQPPSSMSCVVQVSGESRLHRGRRTREAGVALHEATIASLVAERPDPLDWGKGAAQQAQYLHGMRHSSGSAAPAHHGSRLAPWTDDPPPFRPLAPAVDSDSESLPPEAVESKRRRVGVSVACNGCRRKKIRVCTRLEDPVRGRCIVPDIGADDSAMASVRPAPTAATTLCSASIATAPPSRTSPRRWCWRWSAASTRCPRPI